MVMLTPSIITTLLATGVETVLGFACDSKATDVQGSLARIADFKIL